MSSEKLNPEIIAYIHNVSPKKRNKRDTTDYSTLELQVDDASGFHKALCFSKTKRKLLVEKEQSRIPIKITRYTRTSDKKKIIINDMTQLANVNDLEYSFQHEEKDANETFSTVEEAVNDEVGSESVNILAKIVKIYPTKDVRKNNDSWKVAKAVGVDATGKINMEFWNDYILQVTVGNTYMFRDLRRRCWNDVTKLTTSFASTISETSEPPSFQSLEYADNTDEDSNEETVNVPSIEAVESVHKYKACGSCSKRILQPNRVVKCDHCQYSMRLDRCKTKLHAVIVIESSEGETEKKRKLTIFEDVLLKHVIDGDIETKDIDTELVIEKLLFLENVRITFNERNIVTCIGFY